MIEIVAALATSIILLLSAALHPRSANCPPLWYLSDGVSSTGEFTCSAPLPSCCGDARGPCERVKCPNGPTLSGQIYCTGGAKPIVVDFHIVGCQRR